MPSNNEQINFQPLDAEIPEGYRIDVGLPYDDNRGYGWITEDSAGTATSVPLDVSNGARERDRVADQRVDTFMHMQFPNRTFGAWEYAIDNGTYEVTVGVGDPAISDSIHQINVEGVETIAGFEPSSGERFASGTATVEVTDGKLTVDALGGTNTKIDLIRFAPVIETESIAKINFQSEDAETPEGYRVDLGRSYDANRGYGWIREDSVGEAAIPWDRSDQGRDRELVEDQRVDTLMHMQYPGRVAGAWEYDLPEGTYSVTVGVGDAAPSESVHQINIEGEELIGDFTPEGTQNFEVATATVEVTDGKLTVDAIGGTNTKIDYLEIAATNESPNINNAAIEIENLDGAPYSDRLVFSRYGSLTDSPSDRFHDVAELRIKNTGSDPLEIEDLTIVGPWELVDDSVSSATIAPDEALDLGVRFIADSGNLATGSLTIESNDNDDPETVVELSGFWQPDSELGEPDLFESLKLLGYTTEIIGEDQQLNQQGLVQAIGEEVLSPYWQAADPSQPIQIRQLAAYHINPSKASVFWYEKGSNEAELIFAHEGQQAQSVLPNLADSTEPAEGIIDFDGTFGFKVDSEWSNPKNNARQKDIENGAPGPAGHHVRFWPARDRQGELIADTYLMTMDYSGINYDYNDNIYLLSNIQPEPQEALYRIDAGSETPYTDTEGNVWSPDTGFFEPADIAVIEDNGPAEFANTEDDLLYQTYRARFTGSTSQEERVLSYELPLDTTEPVDIRLHFAEAFWGVEDRPGEGQRVFDVKIEDTTVMDDFDIITEATGALNAMVVQINDVRVSDGILNLDFDASANFAAINAIEVLQAID